MTPEEEQTLNEKPIKKTISKYTLVKEICKINPHIKYVNARSKGELIELLRLLREEEAEISRQKESNDIHIKFTRRDY